MKQIITAFIISCAAAMHGQSADSVLLHRIDSLTNVAMDLADAKNFDGALEENVKAKSLALETFGRESAPFARVIAGQGYIRFKQRDYVEAEKEYSEAMAIRERVLGKEHPDYEASLDNMMRLFFLSGNFGKAEVYCNDLVDRISRKKGADSSEYLQILYTRAYIFSELHRYKESEDQYLELLNIEERLNGKETKQYSQYLNNLGTLYMAMGRYDESERILKECIRMRSILYGKQDPDYASVLNNLASLYATTGRYEKCEPLYAESLTIRESTFGKENKYYLNALLNMAHLYLEMGHFERSESTFMEALRIGKSVFEQEVETYLTCLQGIGYYHSVAGQDIKAIGYFTESKEICESSVGKGHPQYWSTCMNLGSAYHDTRQFEKAQLLFQEAKELIEMYAGKSHPNYADVIGNIGLQYYSQGLYEAAEPYYLEAIAHVEDTKGKMNADYAQKMKSIALLYEQSGQFEKAEPAYTEALDLLGKTLGTEHPKYANCLSGIATLYWHIGRFHETGEYFDRYSELSKKHALDALHHLSEDEMLLYLSDFELEQARIYSFNQNATNLPSIAKTNFDNTLFYKGLLLNAQQLAKRATLNDTLLDEKAQLLKSYRRLLAAEYAKNVNERTGVLELEDKATAMEKELARSLPEYGEIFQATKWSDVQMNLKSDEAAVEFVRYKLIGRKITDTTMYAALVITRGLTEPVFVPLMSQSSLDLMITPTGSDLPSQMGAVYAENYRGIEANTSYTNMYSGTSLYNALWKPLKSFLENVGTIYYSPAGTLHQINMQFIPVSDNQALSDSFKLVQLNSTRELVIDRQKNSLGNEAVLFGGIQFDNYEIVASTSKNENEMASEVSEMNDLDKSDESWKYLPGTETEVEVLKNQMLKMDMVVHVKKGLTATEASFKNLGTEKELSPRILHIATHGYFFPQPEMNDDIVDTGHIKPVFKSSQDPMMRSGLILAGSNAAWQGKMLTEGQEDGILTAYEISQMNLSNTEMVVLSACETGLGDVQGNEGVYGLQRAFKIAGVKYIIMSLWQVPDKQTSMLMTTFYKKWLEEKMTIPAAFHAAQKELRDMGFDPYQWAGFVLVE